MFAFFSPGKRRRVFLLGNCFLNLKVINNELSSGEVEIWLSLDGQDCVKVPVLFYFISSLGL